MSGKTMLVKRLYEYFNNRDIDAAVNDDARVRRMGEWPRRWICLWARRSS